MTTWLTSTLRITSVQIADVSCIHLYDKTYSTCRFYSVSNKATTAGKPQRKSSFKSINKQATLKHMVVND